MVNDSVAANFEQISVLVHHLINEPATLCRTPVRLTVIKVLFTDAISLTMNRRIADYTQNIFLSKIHLTYENNGFILL